MFCFVSPGLLERIFPCDRMLLVDPPVPPSQPFAKQNFAPWAPSPGRWVRKWRHWYLRFPSSLLVCGYMPWSHEKPKNNKNVRPSVFWIRKKTNTGGVYLVCAWISILSSLCTIRNYPGSSGVIANVLLRSCVSPSYLQRRMWEFRSPYYYYCTHVLLNGFEKWSIP